MLFDYHFKGKAVKGSPEGNHRTGFFVDWLQSRIDDNTIDIDFQFDDEGYVSDKITEKDIASWRAKIPVIISAPTGSGKNTFIQKTLLKYAIENKQGERDRVLVLSNRIALNRQSKQKLAEQVVQYTGEYGHLERLKEYYTAEGSDKLCYDFGPVTICSYHQLWERKLLDTRKFKYIICDECHFFTNDATFNPHTDSILRYIVNNCQDSIRIYMSATIDTVFEAIIREEFRNTENLIKAKEKEHDDFCNDPTVLMNIQQSRQHIPYIISNRQVARSNMNLLMDQFKRTHTFQLKFYYMHRIYPQIDTVYHYSYYDEMVIKILADKDRSHKWLYFVSDNNTGEKISASFARKDRTSTFISRKRVDDMPDIKKVYDAIIENEYCRDDVLVSTSILDNGINLKHCPNGDHIVGVIIDAFRKDQFLQMLGRARMGKDEKFNLFIRDIKTDELKVKATRYMDDLVKRLRIDQESIETKQKHYDKELFRFTNDEDFMAYNQLAILQICHLMIPILRCLRCSEKPYLELIHCSTMELDACRVKALKYYKNGHGIANLYSELIVSILESQTPQYNHFFEYYLLNKLIPDYIGKKCKEIYLQLKECHPEVKHQLDWEEGSFSPYYFNEPDCVYYVINLLKENGINVAVTQVDRYKEILSHYQDFDMEGYRTNSMTSIQEQLDWIHRYLNQSFKVETLNGPKE